MEGGFAYNPASVKNVKNKAKQKSTVIPHPIFLKLKRHINDKYWQVFFDRLALNKFPTGFSFYSGSLFYKKGAKSPKIPITEDNEETANIVIEFLRTHGSYYSPEEEKKLQDEKDEEEKDETYEWKKLKKTEKTLYIENYIDMMIDEWDLDDAEKDQFSELIFESIDNGQIKGTRINLSKTRIESIDDVDFDEDKRSFEIKLTAKRISKPSVRQKVDPIKKKWMDAVLKKVKNKASCKSKD